MLWKIRAQSSVLNMNDSRLAAHVNDRSSGNRFTLHNKAREKQANFTSGTWGFMEQRRWCWCSTREEAQSAQLLLQHFSTAYALGCRFYTGHHVFIVQKSSNQALLFIYLFMHLLYFSIFKFLLYYFIILFVHF